MGCTTPALNLWSRMRRGIPDLEEAVWGEISNAFSEPVTESDTKADYALTQVWARGGHSFALFNLNDARLVSCAFSTVEWINHKFSKQEAAYDVAADGSVVERRLPPRGEIHDDNESGGS